jgi:hypothetical protein
MKPNIIRKFNIIILSGLFLFSGTGFSFAQFSMGGDEELTMPTLDDILGDVEERYAMDPNALRRSRHKEIAPAAEIFFDSTSPKEGEKVTATALPTNFKNSNENLYYTWFIIHKDGTSDIEKAKREAMGIVARGSFDPELFGIDYNKDGGDDDGFYAPVGGSDGVGAQEGGGDTLGDYENDHFLDPASKEVVDSGKITRCYRHNFGGVSYYGDSKNVGSTEGFSGKDMIVRCSHKFPKAEKGSELIINYENGESKKFTCSDNHRIGNGKFEKNEEACWRLNPKNPDTDGDGINDEADVAGLAQTQFTWTYQDGDRVGVIIEGTSNIPINEDNTTGTPEDEGDERGMKFALDDIGGDGGELMDEFLDGHEEDTSGLTSYHKITWAGLGICSNKEKDVLKNDDCDGSEDYGLTFLKLKDVYEKGGDLLAADLIKNPENPQFDVLQEEYSDFVNITAGIKDKEINKNFVYFDWEIYKCTEEDSGCFDLNAKMERITSDCGEAETLGDCAEYDDEKAIESNSYAEGIGQDKITFRPLANLMEQEKEYFKIILKTKEYKSSEEYSLSDITFSVVKNNAKIQFFKLNKQVDGKLGFNEDEDEICTKGIYKDVCPVYPFQIIAVRSSFSGTEDDEAEGHVWQINRSSLNPPLKCSEYFGNFEDKNGKERAICEREDLAIFPVIGGDLSLSSITANIKKGSSNNLISERIYSINQPLAKIISTDLETAWPFVKHDSSESDRVFQAESGSAVSFKANIIPDYLELEDVKLTWLYNGEEVDEKFIEKNEGLEVGLEENVISFKTLEDIPSSISITARVEKVFYADDIRLLSEGWNILSTTNLSKDSTITVKRWVSDEEKVEEESASLKLFLASTIRNIPEHLLFVMRLAIILILVLTVVFGASYLLERKEGK